MNGLIILLDNTRPKRVGAVVGEIRFFMDTNKPKGIRIPHEKDGKVYPLISQYIFYWDIGGEVAIS